MKKTRTPKRALLIKISLGLGLLIFCAVLVPFAYINIGCKTYNDAPATPQSSVIEQKYIRNKAATYLTLPEWYIVYSTAEYAAFINNNSPSGFPYFRSIGQYWQYYREVNCASKKLSSDWGDHLMLIVIGESFSAENAVKGMYENTVGRLSELTSLNKPTQEDLFAQKTAKEYADFMHTIPWYEFPFSKTLGALWSETPFWGPYPLRKWERKLALSLEYGSKAIYGFIISKATGAVYAPEELEIQAVVNASQAALDSEPRVHIIKNLGTQSYLIGIPRYQAFTDILPMLAKRGVAFVDVAGNNEILITAIAPQPWQYTLKEGIVLFETPLLTQPEQKRVAITIPVAALAMALNQLTDTGISIEHVYDY